MTFLSDDQQRQLHDSIDKYFSANYHFESRQALAASALGYSAEHWSKFAEFGWLGIPFPEEFGGLGGSIVDASYLFQAMGQSLALEPMLATVQAGRLIAQGSNDALKEVVLSQIIAGESVAALAYEEVGSNGNPANVSVSATTEGDFYRIRGEKTSVINAPQARYIVVSARLSGEQLDGSGIGLFVIDTASVELAQTAFTMVDNHQSANIQFDTLLPRDSLIADNGTSYRLLQAAIQDGILMSCNETLGVMKSLLDATARYLSERKQFGVPLATFQVLKHRLADMYMACHSAESLLQEVMSAKTITSEDASVLKTHIAKTGRLVGDTAIQLHGGMGMTDELNVGHYVKRIIVLSALFGNADFHLKKIWLETCE